MKKEAITVQVTVNAPLSRVWEKWITPQDIMNWNNATDDWYTPSAQNDLRVGGKFTSRMSSRDGSMSFDFSGVYYEVIPEKKLAYNLGDERKVSVEFNVVKDGVQVTEIFDREHENSAEAQRTGWQAILDNFKRYVEKA